MISKQDNVLPVWDYTYLVTFNFGFCPVLHISKSGCPMHLPVTKKFSNTGSNKKEVLTLYPHSHTVSTAVFITICLCQHQTHPSPSPAVQSLPFPPSPPSLARAPSDPTPHTNWRSSADTSGCKRPQWYCNITLG